MKIKIRSIVFIFVGVLLMCVLGWAGYDAYSTAKQEQQTVMEDANVNEMSEELPEAKKRTIMLKYENGELTGIYDRGETPMTLEEVEEIFDEDEEN